MKNSKAGFVLNIFSFLQLSATLAFLVLCFYAPFDPAGLGFFLVAIFHIVTAMISGVNAYFAREGHNIGGMFFSFFGMVSSGVLLFHYAYGGGEYIRLFRPNWNTFSIGMASILGAFLVQLWLFKRTEDVLEKEENNND